MYDYIDLYCERTAPEFWNEPLNALTNIFFILAAYFGYSLWKKSDKKQDILVLIFLAGCVGVGSFLFHTMATYWALLADVIPITLFIFLSLHIFLTRKAGFNGKKSLLYIVIFAVINFYLAELFPPNFLNGSVEYIPALILLMIFGNYSFKHQIAGGKDFVLAASVFMLSLTFRSIDNEICSLDPTGTGTHFLWHTLNGILLYLVIRGLIRK